MNFTRHLPTNNRTNAQGRNTMLTSRWNKTRQLLKGCLFGGLITVLSVTGAQATDIRYFHNDHLGTPQVMTDENQTVVWDVEYDPFGKATVNAETVTNNVRFPGQYYDDEVGLHYNYYRNYDPSVGRYITSDPSGLDGGISTYSYVKQNPLIYKDILGLEITGEWVRAPSLDYGDIVITGIEFDSDYRALPPAISLINTLWYVQGKVSGTIECRETNDCGEIVDEWEIVPYASFGKNIGVPVWLNALPPQYSIPIAIAEAAYEVQDHYNQLVVDSITKLYSEAPCELCKSNKPR